MPVSMPFASSKPVSPFEQAQPLLWKQLQKSQSERRHQQTESRRAKVKHSIGHDSSRERNLHTPSIASQECFGSKTPTSDVRFQGRANPRLRSLPQSTDSRLISESTTRRFLSTSEQSRTVQKDFVSGSMNDHPSAPVESWLKRRATETNDNVMRLLTESSETACASSARTFEGSLKTLGVTLPHTTALMRWLDQLNADSPWTSAQRCRAQALYHDRPALSQAVEVEEIPRDTVRTAHTDNSALEGEQNFHSARTHFSIGTCESLNDLETASYDIVDSSLTKFGAQSFSPSKHVNHEAMESRGPRAENVITLENKRAEIECHSLSAKQHGRPGHLVDVMENVRIAETILQLSSPTVAKVWRRSYREKPISRVQIPSCFTVT